MTSINSCKNNEKSVEFSEQIVDLHTHILTTYSVIQNSKYLIVFESGLGNDNSVWRIQKVADKIAEKSDVLLYDRAGYGKSTKGPIPRNIENLSLDLENVINEYSGKRKVILVGHSFGGVIIRDYAIKHPNKTAAILFIDPSHELAYQITQQEQADSIYNSYKDKFGIDHGATMEAKPIIEDLQYMSSASDLPDIQIIVITSMKIPDKFNESIMQLWYDIHETLGSGVSDFTHISTTKAGHYIMLDEPELVLKQINDILLKLN